MRTLMAMPNASLKILKSLAFLSIVKARDIIGTKVLEREFTAIPDRVFVTVRKKAYV